MVFWIRDHNYCLVGDRFEAECKNPIPSDKEIVLKHSASCFIHKKSSKEEIEKKFRREKEVFKIISEEGHGLSHDIIRCKCCILPRLRKKHTGADRFPPFFIERIEKNPGICFIDVRSDLKWHAKIEDFIKPIL